MSTTPGNEPEVKETKIEQLPPPPETIYVAELDPNSPENKAAAEKKEKEDREKEYQVREELRIQEVAERKQEISDLLRFVKGRLKDYSNEDLDTRRGGFGKYCERFVKKIPYTKIHEMDVEKYTPVDRRLIKIMGKIGELVSTNHPKVILGILEDVGGDFGMERVSSMALLYLADDA